MERRVGSSAAVRRTPRSAAAIAWLVRRELLRFARQPSRIVAAVGTPALMWGVLASGFARSFVPDEIGVAGGEGGDAYGAYLLPGTASMIVLFSSIFAAISLIEDRRAGFLQSVLVSPAPGWAVVGSKVAACALLATGQGALVLLGAPLVGLDVSPTGAVLALGALAAISLGVSGVGLAGAWRADSVQGFHGVMNLVLMPMWLLSGALFPIGGASAWLGWVMRLNPLSWATEALRGSLASEPVRAHAWAWLGTAVFAAAGPALAWVTMRRGR